MYNLDRYYNWPSMKPGWLRDVLKLCAAEYREMREGKRCVRCRKLQADCPCGDKAVLEKKGTAAWNGK